MQTCCWKSLPATLMILIPALLAYGIWPAYTRLAIGDAAAFSKHSLSIGNYAQSVSERGLGEIFRLLGGFGGAMLRLSKWYYVIGLAGLAGCALTYRLYRRERNCDGATRVGLVGWAAALLAVIYLSGLLLVYAFSLSPREQQVFAGIDRDVSSRMIYGFRV